MDLPKFPYLKKVGWKGLVTGKESGVYQATPLSRLNAADGMTTPLAQEAYEQFYETMGGTLATHWARLIELLYAAEYLVELATDPEITEGLLNRVEMAFRSYNPCLGCATHTLPRRMPLEVMARDCRGNELDG